jgi:hypothetical protein
MGQTARTTKLLLDLSARDQGGTNAGKRVSLEETVKILDAARQFYLAFFLAHPDKLLERVEVISRKTGEVREGVIPADNSTSLGRIPDRRDPRASRSSPRVELQPGVSRFPESLSSLSHQRLRGPRPRLSHHTPEMAEFREEERETRRPNCF